MEVTSEKTSHAKRDICEKSYKRKAILDRHVASMHKVEKNIVTIYKHVSNPNIFITVDHHTRELHAEQSGEAKTFIQDYPGF